MNVTKVAQGEYAELINIWEHCYLDLNPRGDIKDVFEIKMTLYNYIIDSLELRCVRSITSKIIGFIGIYKESIELFCVLPTHRSIGVGPMLLRYAIDEISVNNITRERFRIMNECFYR